MPIFGKTSPRKETVSDTEAKNKIGNCVWFNMSDDIFCGNDYNNNPKPRIGRITKYQRDFQIYWITTILAIPKNVAIPAWGIPCNLVKFMEPEEEMLVMLENSN